MNENWKIWLNAHKNKLALLLIVVLVAAFWTVTDKRVSDVEQDLEEMYSPLKPYLPDETQATIDDLLAKWAELAPTVISIEDWLEEQGAVTYGYQTAVYMTDGGDRQIVASGGEIEVQSGGQIDAQTGSTVSLAGTVNFTGATVSGLTMSGGTIDGDLVVTGTATIAGAKDATQLLVTSYTTNTNSLVIFEQADGTDIWNLNNDGQLSSANGAVSVIDTFIVDGQEDTPQVTFQGFTTQTTAIQLWEQYDGTDVARMSNAGNLQLEGTLEVTGTATLASTLAVTGAVTLQGAFYSSFANLTVTDGDTVTPTYTTYALDSGGAVTITLAATGTEGQILILIGDDANDITINDTNVRTNDGGVQVINQWDIVMWVYQDAEWVELSESSNS